MKPLLHALIVEDSQNDADLLLRDLENSYYEIVHQRVETAEALCAALDRRSWDILFCDFTLPHFSGQAALEIVRKRDLDLPFIFVSGTMGEDVAVQAMKAGAHDYVMKNNLTRLIPAMERELREANVRRQRRQAEEDIRISEYKYRHLFENLGDAALLIEMETGQIIDANPQAEALLGRPRAEILGMRENQLYPPQRGYALLSSGVREQRIESNILRKNGTIVPVYVSVSKFDFYDRHVLLALIQDLTNRKWSEKKIQEQSNLLELAHDAIFVCSLDEKIQYWNKGAEQLYGWTAKEAMDGGFGRMAYEDRTSFETAKKILLEQGCWSGEVRKLTKARRTVVVASRWTLVRDGEGNPSSILVIDTDITEQKQMEALFLRDQRIELIGTLAGGIAHDLNNILQVIITNLDLAISAPTFNESLPKYLDDASQGAHRAAHLARRLLTFSKGGAPVKKSLDIAETVIPAVLLALSGSKLKPFFAFQLDLYPVIGDPIQLTQVIENVVINACEATPQKGKLLVRAENIDERNPASADLPFGRYVRIQIEDRGSGIPESIRDRIFEICFTTKAGGSGLGLATIRSIMHQHGGSITIESVVGRGTIVSLMLPAAAHRPESPVAAVPPPVVKTTGRILVIDDEEMILSVVGSMLKTLGYECAGALDGLEGCNEFMRAKADGNPFAAVLLDATIPNALSGEDALKLLLAVDPDARVILCSGYANGDLFKEAEQLGFKAVLAKPFSISELVPVLNKVLSPS
ncbi:MAG: response regulator [Verrucomicrobia bacterium]|nr:response regulator [Verrucomicrobiota bacterium]